MKTLLLSPMFQDLAASMARTALALTAGALAAKGIIGGGMTDQFVGVGMSLFVALWSLWAKVLANSN